MAVMFKIKDDLNVLEIWIEDDFISVWSGREFDYQCWNNVKLTKDDTVELIKYLQKLIERI